MAEVRVCGNCKHHNGITQMECEKCGFDISMTAPINESVIVMNSSFGEPQRDISSNCVWRLSEIAANQVFYVSETLKVGREESPLADLLNKSDFVSRMHARLEIRDGLLYVTDFSTNGTFVNGVRALKGDAMQLHDGDELKFADVSFKVVK